MVKKYIENNTANVIYVGGKMIAPGEGREVEVPEGSDAAPQAPTPEPDADAPLRELLAGNVAAVTAGLAEFSPEALQRLQDLEQAAKAPRKGVLAALADERIKRADAALKSDPL